MNAQITDEFLRNASVPRDESHVSGDLVRAGEILDAHPGIGASSIHAAAVLGDHESVGRFLDGDRSLARTRGGPQDWDPLTYLCFSRFLRLDPGRGDGFVRAAKALLDAGADANTGWYADSHQPRPEWESVIYGAAAVARNADLTRLLLARGADPNDAETPYHVPETYDNTVLAILVESRRLTPDSLAIMLLRKADWHDLDGIEFLLRHGADPNRTTPWGYTALHQSLRRDNGVRGIELLLEHGADPAIPGRDGLSGAGIAARRGRGDVLDLLQRRGQLPLVAGLEAVLVACARGEEVAIGGEVAAQVRSIGATLLAEFAGNDNAEGVERLLSLGVPVDARYGGDGYWDLAPDSTALHVAAWRAAHRVVELLVRRGAPVNARDGAGRTPLHLAVRACVDSYWMGRRSPASVAALLAAAADPAGITLPTGYGDIDRLLMGKPA